MAPNTGEDWRNRNSSLAADGNADGAATWEDSSEFSYETKHSLTRQASSNTPWCLPKGGENLCSHNNPHTNVYSNFIPNSLKLETTKMSFKSGRDK